MRYERTTMSLLADRCKKKYNVANTNITKAAVFWYMTTCSLEKRYKRFGGTLVF